jgi:hypothetical protein
MDQPSTRARITATVLEFARLFETVPEKSVPSHRNGPRCKTRKGRIRLRCPGAKVGKERPQIDEPTVRCCTYFLTRTGAALDSASTGNGVRYVVADVPGQNLRTALYTWVFVFDEAPKMGERNGLVPQCPIHIAHAGSVRLQVQCHDRLETSWHTGDLDQFRRRQPQATDSNSEIPPPKSGPGSGSDSGEVNAQGTGSSPEGREPKPPVDPGEQGKIIGWGIGQSKEAVEQTRSVTDSWTPDKVKEMIAEGLDKDWLLKTQGHTRTT